MKIVALIEDDILQSDELRLAVALNSLAGATVLALLYVVGPVQLAEAPLEGHQSGTEEPPRGVERRSRAQFDLNNNPAAQSNQVRHYETMIRYKNSFPVPHER